MTNLTTAVFGPASLRVLRISYRCDLSSKGGVVIPLGILADMKAGDHYALGLVARKALGPDEKTLIGQLVREDLSKPFKYLEPIFQDVIQAASSGKAFETLQDRYTLSLVFEMAGPAEAIPLPPAAKVRAEARKLWLKDELRSHGNAAYWGMFGEAVPDAVDKSSKEDVAA